MQLWRDALQSYWELDRALERLDGEFDLNFAVAGDPGQVLKIMRVDCAPDLVDMQCKALEHIAKAAPDVAVPRVVRSRAGALFEAIPAENQTRLAWLLERLPGRCYANHRPHSPDLIRQVGAELGRVDQALQNFQHRYLDREFKWDLMRAGWISASLDVVSDPDRRSILSAIIERYQAVLPGLRALPKQAIHNDANDYNLLVTGGLATRARLTGLIDFGDMCTAPRMCDLAIAAAYIVLDHDDPEAALAALVGGYHETYPLTPAEIDLLWPLVEMRLAVSVVNSTLMARENPDDPYVLVSQAPAWRLLEGGRVNAALLPARLRAACGLPVTDAANRTLAWLSAERGCFASIMGRDLADLPYQSLSAEASAVPRNPFHMSDEEAAAISHDGGARWFLGYYAEPRLVYTDAAFRKGPWASSNRRTVHLAIDVFAPEGTALHSPYPATVVQAEYRAGTHDYGGVVVLEHATPDGDAFFSLYGHLNSESIEGLEAGHRLDMGQKFTELGDPSSNGGWAPHTHVQLALSTKGMGADWPGVADPDEMYLWEALCPNPAALLNLADAEALYIPTSKDETLTARKARFGDNLRLSYAEPLMLVRGWKHHLFDEWGRPYLDAYNNVPHVGHAHPRIQAVAADQLKRLNSNTRYLHPAQTAFAEKILSKLPDAFEVCFFLNSGTEANELALRLARAHSHGKDMVTPDHGYHGNTTGAIDISAYKFNAPGGVGQSDWVQLVEVADDYRGRYRRDDPRRAVKYASQVDEALERIAARGGRLAGFIAETFPSVGGQIIPPEGYLGGVYSRIRAAGGLCIADEVQTGLGRLGETYFGFEQQGVVPDIVVLGKPIGNGHPLGVVITTRAIADSFAEGPEFFSTFGGSTLSCRIGKEVLDIVDDEGLMENARLRGREIIAGLKTLEDRYEAIGDVRGSGLFIGLDLVASRESLEPASELAGYVTNRLRELRVLVGTEGPSHNILKIRPPLTIDAEGARRIVAALDQVLEEAALV